MSVCTTTHQHIASGQREILIDQCLILGRTDTVHKHKRNQQQTNKQCQKVQNHTVSTDRGLIHRHVRIGEKHGTLIPDGTYGILD